VYLSSGNFRRTFAEYYALQVNDTEGLQDKHVNSFLNGEGVGSITTCTISVNVRLLTKYAAHVTSTPQVRQFYPDRSLVQHIGASSSIFGAGHNNRKFHRAERFPFFEKYVIDDRQVDWY
jgi:hypothetical protein